MIQSDKVRDTVNSPNLGLEVEQVGQVTVARVIRSSLLDDKTINAVSSQMASLVLDLHCRRLVVDFSKVRRLSSAMIGKLIGVYKKIQAAGGRLVLCAIDPLVAEIFRTLHLNQLFSIYGEEQEALQSFL